MTIIATDTPRFSDVVNFEFEPSQGYCRDALTFNDTAQTLVVGSVLGKVTATGKYRLALSASSDGSQNPVAVYLGNYYGDSVSVDVLAATDTSIFAMTRGPVILSGQYLALGTGITLSAVKTAFAALNPPMIVEATI